MKYLTFEDAKSRLTQYASEYEKKLEVFFCIVAQLERLFETVRSNIVTIEHNKSATPEIAAIRFCGSQYTIHLEFNPFKHEKAVIILKRISKEKEYENGRIEIDDAGNIIFPGGSKICLFEKDEFEKMVFSFFFNSIGKR